MQGMTGLGNGKQLSKGPATIGKAVSGHRHMKAQSPGHMSYSHSPYSCVKGGTSHPVLVAKVLHSWSNLFKQAHLVANGEAVVFPDTDLLLSPLIPQCMTNSLFLSSFPLASTFLTQGRGIRGFPRLMSHGLETHSAPTQGYRISAAFRRSRSNPFLRSYLLVK